MKLRHIAACSVMFVSLVGCGGNSGAVGDEGDIGEAELAGEVAHNGLDTINGLPYFDSSSATSLGPAEGLDTHNGLDTLNGLDTINGLENEIGLMSTADGRTVVDYLVKCALRSDQSIVKTYDNGTPMTFTGLLGVASEWESGACNTDCKERVSACMLAHLNTTGDHVSIYVVGSDEAFPNIGEGIDLGNYPRQEAAFYGNIFITPPLAYQCDGAEILPDPIPGRAGSSGDKQYKNRGACATDCTATFGIHNDRTPDGYSTCFGYNNVLAVYTEFHTQ